MKKAIVFVRKRSMGMSYWMVVLKNPKGDWFCSYCDQFLLHNYMKFDQKDEVVINFNY